MTDSRTNPSSNGTPHGDPEMSDVAPLPFNDDLLAPPSSNAFSLPSLHRIASVTEASDLSSSTARQAVEDAVELGHQRRAVSRIQDDIDQAQELLQTVRSLREDASIARVKARQSRARASHLRDRIEALAATLPSTPTDGSLPSLPKPLPQESQEPSASPDESASSDPPSTSHALEDPSSTNAGPSNAETPPETSPGTDGHRPLSPQSGGVNRPSTPESSVEDLSRSTLESSSSGQSQQTSPSSSASDAHSPGKSSTSFFYGALYTIAGLVFLAGDVVMSRELVSSAFRLSGTVAPWVFSGALAMLAVLLKPAYTRLVESKYWVGSKRPFVMVIGLTLVMALTCLALLGVYRSQTHANRTQLRHLRQEMQRNSEADLQSVRAQIAEIQRETAQSPYGRASFALVTVLFAVAGAIALGIGIRHLRGFYHWRLLPWWTRRRRRKRLAVLKSDYSEARDDTFAHRRTLARLRSKLDVHPSPSSLRDRISQLRTERQDTLQTLQLIEQSFANEVYEIAGHHSPVSRDSDDATTSSNGRR